MDPNAALTEAREAAYIMAEETPDSGRYAQAADTLVSRFLALDEWLQRQGFPPREWAAGRTATPPSYRATR